MTLYKHARKTPKSGWRHTESAGTIDNGPSLTTIFARSDAQMRQPKAKPSPSPRAKKQQQTMTAMATPDPWLLTVFKPPDRLVALLNRLGLKPNKSRIAWWIKFEVNDKARQHARHIVRELKAAGLVLKQDFHWKQVNRRVKLPSKLHHLTDFSKRPKGRRTQAP